MRQAVAVERVAGAVVVGDGGDGGDGRVALVVLVHRGERRHDTRESAQICASVCHSFVL